MKNSQSILLKLSLLLLACLAFWGCGKIQVVDFDEEIKSYLESNHLLHKVLYENKLSGYEYSSYRKEGLSIQAFLVGKDNTSYIITDLYWEGDAQYRLRAIRYIEGKVGISKSEQKILYLEEKPDRR